MTNDNQQYYKVALQFNVLYLSYIYGIYYKTYIIYYKTGLPLWTLYCPTFFCLVFHYLFLFLRV